MVVASTAIVSSRSRGTHLDLIRLSKKIFRSDSTTPPLSTTARLIEFSPHITQVLIFAAIGHSRRDFWDV